MPIRFACRVASLLLLLTPGGLYAQTTAKPAAPAPVQVPGAIASHPDWPQAKPEDVKSVDAIVASLYDVICGAAGQPRDWDRMRSLFVPAGGRLVVTRVPRPGAPAGAKTDVLFLTVDDYVQRFSAGAAKDGFFESSIANRIDTFGEMTNVWSTYESRHAKTDAKPFARGINSIELLHSGDRYYIVEVYWDAERPDNPIPAKFLKDPR